MPEFAYIILQWAQKLRDTIIPRKECICSTSYVKSFSMIQSTTRIIMVKHTVVIPNKSSRCYIIHDVFKTRIREFIQLTQFVQELRLKLFRRSNIIQFKPRIFVVINSRRNFSSIKLTIMCLNVWPYYPKKGKKINLFRI